MENSNEIWQTSVNGQIYETSFEGLVEWIAEGSLLPQDKVRKGNLRWIEANKVPALHTFFNAKQFENKQVLTSTNTQSSAPPPQVQNFNAPQLQNFQAPPPPTFFKDLTPEAERKFCTIHTDANAKYHCEICSNYFCKACPQASVCPMCGATCKVIDIPAVMPPPVFQQTTPQINQNEEVFIDEDVKKASSWFFWKAGLSVVNGLLFLAGAYWEFAFGLTFPQFIHGFLLGLTGREELIVKADLSASPFNGAVFIITLIGAGMTGFFGYQSRQARKWAFIFGFIIFSFDAIMCLISFSIIGGILNGIGIYILSKGYSGCNNK